MSFSATAYDNYNKPFVFLENGIEFAVFKDGQFDFNILNPVRNYGHVSIQTRNINFSFNTGHNYDAFVQYDDYGAVLQIENTTIDYDYFGKVRRIGNVHLYYNPAGLVSGIGNLHIAYNNGYVAHCSGYVNNYNVNYGFRPHHRYYRVPPVNRCVVYTRPYRRNYIANRYDYVVYRRNYHNNFYHRPYRSRNYYRPGQHITRRAVATNAGRFNNHPATNYNRKKVIVNNSPNRKAYSRHNSTSRNYEPKRTYSSQSHKSKSYERSNKTNSRTYANNRSNTNSTFSERFSRSNSNYKATPQRKYSTKKVVASTESSRSYRRR